MSTGRAIRLVGEDGGWWSAIGEDTEVAGQGEMRERAPENLDEALEATAEARNADTRAPEPDAPWFDDE